MDQHRQLLDAQAVRVFAEQMIVKMDRSRDKGRDGWWTCPIKDLWSELRQQVEKGDPVDVANLAMMIWHNESAADAAR